MEIISLELLWRDALQHEWNHCGPVALRQFRVEQAELSGVGRPIVGRELDTEQQYFAARQFYLANDLAQITFDFGDGGTAQPVVRTQFQHHHSGSVLLQQTADSA